jgi:hypothetical protein
VSAGNSMSAQSMSWIVAGLGAYRGLVDLTVYWTDGRVDHTRRLQPGRYHDVGYGSGTHGPETTETGERGRNGA